MQTPRAVVGAASASLVLLIALAPLVALAASPVRLRLPQRDAAGAKVEVWPASSGRPWLDRGGFSLADRGCPDDVPALLDALGSAPEVSPLARAVAGPDGRVELPAGAAADAWVVARSVDGAWGAQARVGELGDELRLLPLVQVRFRLPARRSWLSRATAQSMAW